VTQSLAPVTETVTSIAPTPPTAAAARPHPRRTARRRTGRRPRAARSKRHVTPSPVRRPAPVAAPVTSDPAPAPPAPDQVPAAEREFGL
jgi:hypothetical protein